VLETFLRQAREGTPLTLTDRRMTRYWMTMDEARDLLWHALGLESGSHTLLDTGEPIPVESLARRLFGLVHGDGAEPEWRVLGSRPGERLAEELVSASEFLAPCDAGAALRIIREGPVVSAETLAGMVDELRHVIARGAPEPIRDAVMGMAKSLQ
jgi:FlaA1/EpsC-like NDP-sugar epimerase